MFSALKKLTKINDDRCPAPTPMSSSLQKKFSRGVHFNMKILIKGDRNVGKSCLLQRLQGGSFVEEYVPTDQIQVAPIHWTYKNTDHIVKVEVWEVVDKGRTKKKAPLGLKLENQSAAKTDDDSYETPVLDATFLDVYKNTSGVILMLDITKPWTYEYVVKELKNVPADLPVVVLGNHCDMQHHRQVHPHHIDQLMYQAKLDRTAPIRYAESSMRNGFGLRLLHKFLSIPFLRLQRTSLLEQLQRNQKDIEEVECELDDFQNSDESQYNIFVDKLANKRRQNLGAQDVQPSSDRSPSIVLGAGKPIVPPDVNPLLAQSLNPMGLKAHYSTPENPRIRQTQYVSADLIKPKQQASVQPQMEQVGKEKEPTSGRTTSSSGALDDFYAGALDNSFLDDLTPISIPEEVNLRNYESDSDEGNTSNPMVTNDQDDLDIEFSMTSPVHRNVFKEKAHITETKINNIEKISSTDNLDVLSERLMTGVAVTNKEIEIHTRKASIDIEPMPYDTNEIWPVDPSVRRSPEGGEDPDLSTEAQSLPLEKKHKKSKKSKDKDKDDYSSKSERKEKKHKHKKSKRLAGIENEAGSGYTKQPELEFVVKGVPMGRQLPLPGLYESARYA
ncbi:Rab-like protein 6 [Eumeta japonica]|uniref:Rab-like protein 6 n=1 Tax=Eumeta variegata TaxID=151549 RepID=A0A4C1YH29_EUMVA|nr:Rab-like protein 6 [Eumeta japonica]